jgi:aminomethyltransferase
MFLICFDRKMLCLKRRATSGLHKLLLARALATEVQTARKTCLYDFHVAKGGRMVEFAGFLLPVQYADQGLSTSHRHVRAHCGVFDVSHMLQTKIKGRDRLAFLESLCVADLQSLADNGAAALTVFTTPTGGVIDDLVVTRSPLGEFP